MDKDLKFEIETRKKCLELAASRQATFAAILRLSDCYYEYVMTGEHNLELLNSR